MHRKLVASVLVLALAVGAAGCKLKINRLEKRLDRWQSMQSNDSDPEKKYRFARESAIFFLISDELQRIRDAIVTEQERLTYHRQMAQMQIFMIDYHASKALAAISVNSPDWELGRTEWAKADTLCQGQLPGYPTTYRLVHIQRGYENFLIEIATQPGQYERLERDFTGLMAAFRKMSEFKFREAEHYLDQGYYDLAIENYLLVLCRDGDRFHSANQAVERLTGRSIRQTYDYHAWVKRAQDSYEGDCMELYHFVENTIAQMAKDVGEDSARTNEPAIAAAYADRYNVAPEQVIDIYYFAKTRADGTLPQSLLRWAPEVLRGQKALRLPPLN